ncbi:MAG: pseudaminic acid synthase [Candidatus Amulumruptor caecigallinarius]|nr:pseudaminic acid synthase [Candidatus Amulumruptor caecigallinarius]
MENNTPRKCKIVAELSANHGHSLQTAVESVRAAAKAGADAVKLQTYTPESLTLNVRSDDFLLKGGLWDGRYLYDLYREAMTPWEWHAELFRTAAECGIECFSTPFDKEGVDLLESLGNPIYKIASFEIAHQELIAYAASKGKPVVISTGIASVREIEEAVRICRDAGNNDITLLKCTSAYPARVEDAQLSLMPEMGRRFGVKTGLSDHSAGSLLPILSVALGGVMIEKHFILDRKIGGPDAAFSMECAEFASMVREVRRAEAALGREAVLPESEHMSRTGRQWGRSIYVSRPIAAGERFSEHNVACVRPGFSLHPREYDRLLRNIAVRDYVPGERISEKDLQE